MSSVSDSDRRRFLGNAGRLTAGLILGAGVPAIAFDEDKGHKKKDEPEDVGPTEDLMREHGVLNRVLLIYDHFIDQIDRKQDLQPDFVIGAANIIRKFVEDYHERQEEQFLFPRFQKAGVLSDLVQVLKTQHEAGRKLTDRVTILASSRVAGDRVKLAQDLRLFIRMYRPHEAREDTVLFPELRKIVSRDEFDALGEEFEKNEHKQFGADGFELYRDKVGEIEKRLGIYDLAQFTPKESDRR